MRESIASREKLADAGKPVEMAISTYGSLDIFVIHSADVSPEVSFESISDKELDDALELRLTNSFEV